MQVCTILMLCQETAGPSFMLPEEFIWSSVYLSKEDSARILLEDDVSVIALGLNIQFAFHLAQLML